MITCTYPTLKLYTVLSTLTQEQLLIATQARPDQVQADYFEDELDRRDTCIDRLQEQVTRLKSSLSLSKNPDAFVLLDPGVNDYC